MNITQFHLTKNDCYRKHVRRNKTLGIVVHDAGAVNPTLKRYVNPDDGKLGENLYNNDWNRSGTGKCVHAFTGKLNDGSVATYQTLPWEYRGWHVGGTGNDTHIGIELCRGGDDDKEYFEAAYRELVEVCAYLCMELDIDTENVIGHYEAHAMGIASNHSDPKGYFAVFGKTMDDFRNEVREQMEKNEQLKVKVGENKAVPAVLIDGVTYVPLREILLAVQPTVTWTPDEGAKVVL